MSLPILSKLVKNKNKNEVNNLQNKSLELSLLLSIPASLALIIGSEEIVGALFGYGSFTEDDIKLTSLALKYFGYGIPAFALLKIFANFFFARDNTLTPFRISVLVVTVNVFVSLTFFKQIGFIIIPLATTFSTWIGVICYSYLLIKKTYIKIESNFYKNLTKIVFSTIVMSYFFYQCINYFSSNLTYSSDYKILYLLFIVILVALLYFSICYFLKVLDFKSYKIN